MAETIQNRFNLVDEKWIPVANEGLVSLADIFTKTHLTALGGNPVQKIAITKLLLAIVQSAYTPKNDEEWKLLGVGGMVEKTLEYLSTKKECFWLYGEKPFLQMPSIAQAAKQPLGAVTSGVATGNTTVLTQTQIERVLTDAEKALLLVELGNFALGGKKTDNSVILSLGYGRKSNEKGKPGTGKPGPSIGFMGFLHNFTLGATVVETLWLNWFTSEQIATVPYVHSIGSPPWEIMPMGEDCVRARELHTTYIGRLVPLSRFLLLSGEYLHYSEGIFYPGYAEGGFDLSTGVDFSAAKPRALWVDSEKRPWRQLPSLLSFIASERKNSFDCYQLRFSLPRARTVVTSVGIWSGGLSVSSNAGEQYASGTDDFVESEVFLETAWLGEEWFTQLKIEMSILDELAKNVYGCTMGFYKQQLAEGKDQAAQASNLFWQLAEHHFQSLITACGTHTSESLRPIFAQIALQSYNTYCPKDTARQLDAWAASRPQLGKYFNSNTTPHITPSTIKGA